MDENLLVLHLSRDKTNQLTAEGSKMAWLFISNVILRLQGYFIFKIIHFFFCHPPLRMPWYAKATLGSMLVPSAPANLKGKLPIR